MNEIETTTLNDQAVLRHIRNTASWLSNQKTDTGGVWASILLDTCEYLEKRLQFNILINSPGKVVITEGNIDRIEIKESKVNINHEPDLRT